VHLVAPGLPPITTDIAYGGGVFAMVDAKALGWPITPDATADLCRKGALIKQALNDRPGVPEASKAGSVLFFEDVDAGHARHLIVLEQNKFDRSPCGTGSSARLAVLYAQGRLAAGQPFRAEGVLGTYFDMAIEKVTGSGADSRVAPSIRGNAHITSFSTLVVEDGDPLAGGFLCR
jgi:proline racemase